VIETNYKRAKEILETNLEKLHVMAEALIKYETIADDQIKDIMAGRAPRPPEGWDDTPSTGPGGGKAVVTPVGGPAEAPIARPAGQH
jgi:cell division protease FtsH